MTEVKKPQNNAANMLFPKISMPKLNLGKLE